MMSDCSRLKAPPNQRTAGLETRSNGRGLIVGRGAGIGRDRVQGQWEVGGSEEKRGSRRRAKTGAHIQEIRSGVSAQ